MKGGDFTCNLFYMTRDEPLSVRQGLSVSQLVEMTKNKLFQVFELDPERNKDAKFFYQKGGLSPSMERNIYCSMVSTKDLDSCHNHSWYCTILRIEPSEFVLVVEEAKRTRSFVQAEVAGKRRGSSYHVSPDDSRTNVSYHRNNTTDIAIASKFI
jgi:hypothetical protein